MRVWTIQPLAVFRLLQQKTVLHADIALSLNATFEDFRQAYDWLVVQMKRHVGMPPSGVTYPFWAWYIEDWQHRRPDLRGEQFRHLYEPSVCLELELPDAHVLLSDFDAWHFVLNRLYFDDSTSDGEFDAAQAWFDALPKAEQEVQMQRSWEKIFDVTPNHDEWLMRGQNVQATFWELRLADVVDVCVIRWPLEKS